MKPQRPAPPAPAAQRKPLPGPPPRAVPPVYRPGANPVQSYRPVPPGSPPPVYQPARPATAPPPVYRPANATQRKVAAPPKIAAVQRMKQPLITNYFPQKRYISERRRLYQWKKTNGFSDPETWPPVLDNIQYATSNQVEYEAREGNRVVGELELYEDSQGVYWINFVQVPTYARRKGIAARLVQMAINDHGQIYSSLQTAEEDDESDTRHLTAEGYSLVTGCIHKGMKVTLAMPNCK